MPHIKAIIILLALSSMQLFASTDQECLKHTGGAFADVECYNSLSKEMKEENSLLVKKILSTIPKNNKNVYLIKNYIGSTKKQIKYCKLASASLVDWTESPKKQGEPRYYYYDVAYYQCVYSVHAKSNEFLRVLLSNATQ